MPEHPGSLADSEGHSLGAELLRHLQGEHFHEEVHAYLIRAGCSDLGVFSCWVDDAKGWNALLQGPGFPNVTRRHVAHIKDCWERSRQARTKFVAAPQAPAGGVLAQAVSREYIWSSEAAQGPAAAPAASPEVDPEFWKDLIRMRQAKAAQIRSTSDLSVKDLCDITAERLDYIFEQFDTDCDGTIDAEELSQALEWLGFTMGVDGARKILIHVLEKQSKISIGEWGASRRSFELMLKWLRMAELFTPTSGFIQWDPGEQREVCPLICCDYNAESCELMEPLKDDDGLSFSFGKYDKHSGISASGRQSRMIRWLHMDAMKGLDRLTLLRLAIKYDLHPLPIDDVIQNRAQTKVERFNGYFVISVDILSLPQGFGPEAYGKQEPPRVHIHRSHVTIFLAQPPHCKSLLTIHQDSEDKSSWLSMWREDDGAPAAGEELLSLWADLLRDLEFGRNRAAVMPVASTSSGGEDNRPPKRMREEAADFLLFEVLHRIVLQLRPIAEAYARRLGFMHKQPPHRVPQAWMKEVAEIKLEVYDFMRSVRPLRQVVKNLIDEAQLSDVTRVYLAEVAEEIEEMAQDVGHLTKMADTLEGANHQYRDKRTNDTLLALSVVTAIFLPLQFVTGWYGMNFTTMDELNWTREKNGISGYDYLFILMAATLFSTVVAIVLVVSGCRGCPPCCCRAALSREEARTRIGERRKSRRSLEG